MGGMGPVDLFKKSCRLHVGREVAPGVTSAKQSEGIERGAINVVGEAPMDLGHCAGVGPVALLLVTAAEQNLHGSEIRLLALAVRLGSARLGCRRKLSKGLACRCEVLLHPDRMVVSHRFTPVRQGETRIGFLRRLERGCRELV